MSELVAIDIGGTHTRFAIADVQRDRPIALSHELTVKTAAHESLQAAWQAYGDAIGRPLPASAGIAVACPVDGEVLKLTNNAWSIVPARLAESLGVERYTLVNDFAAIAHCVARTAGGDLVHLGGPDLPLPARGMITVIGPGTGLGVAGLLRDADSYRVVPTEAGHIDFAPLDALDDAILSHLRHRYGRVSVERIVSGPGLAHLYDALGALQGGTVGVRDDAALWAAALAGDDQLAVAALERFCLSFGAVAGDVALAHGAAAVVMAGSLAGRLGSQLTRGGFRQRFAAKGRFRDMMEALPVKILTIDQPGLHGAAAAFAQAYES